MTAVAHYSRSGLAVDLEWIQLFSLNKLFFVSVKVLLDTLPDRPWALVGGPCCKYPKHTIVNSYHVSMFLMSWSFTVH